MKIQSLQIGKIKNYKNFQSAFIKDIYLEKTQIDFLGILDDQIADKIHHGSYHKAIFLILIKKSILHGKDLAKFWING